MKLFRGKTFVWSEPWFFCQRIRDRSDWLKALLPALLVSCGLAALLLFRGVNMAWWWTILVALGGGAAVQLGIEAAFLRRDISIDETRIEAFGNAGQFTSYASYPIPQITWLELRRPEEIGMRFGMLVLRTSTDGGVIGIPTSISLEQLARTLHRMGVPVALSGWAAPSDAERDAPEFVYSAAPEAPLENARVDSVPEGDRNLMPMADMLIALVIGCWFVLLWLGLMGWVGVYLYQQRQVLGIWTILASAVFMFASLTIPFGYYELFGDYSSAQYLIGAARKRVQARSESVIRSFEDRTFAVEIIRRDTWGGIAPKVIDFGFLQVEPDRRRIVYEGNAERWTVPLAAVKRCHVEEVQYGTAGESATGELRAFVVLEVQTSAGSHEAVLRVADKEIGKATDNRRLRKARELFEAITQDV